MTSPQQVEGQPTPPQQVRESGDWYPFKWVDDAVVCECGHDLADHLPSDEGCWECGCVAYAEAGAVATA